MAKNNYSEYLEYCECCDRFIKLGEECCSMHQANFDNCRFGFKKLCNDCIKICQDCETTYCLECWKKKDDFEFPCISHRHCKSCAEKPTICNIYPMSACSCGCGNYSLHTLIWKSKQDRDIAKKHLERYETVKYKKK